MPSVIKNSFQGGIVDESLSARVDLAKYNVSCRQLKNFILQPQGGVYRRPGLRFIAEPAADGTPSGSGVQPTLIPLVYNSETSYIVALLEEIWKVYTDKAYLDEGTSPFTAEQSETADYAQSADTLYLVQREAEPFKIIRVSTSNFEDTVLAFDSNYPSPSSLVAVYSGTTGSTTIQYAVVALTDDGQESLPSFAEVSNGQTPAAWSSNSLTTLTWGSPGSQFGSKDIRAIVIYETSPLANLVGEGGIGSYSSNGFDYTLVGNMQFGSDDIYGLALDSAGLFYVAVGENGKGSRSTNGTIWTAVSNMQFSTTDINAVKFSSTAGAFVAVGNSGKGSRSTNNGVTWVAIGDMKQGTGSIRAIDVNETGPRFIAVGSGASYSDDNGITWTAISGWPVGPFNNSIVYDSDATRWVSVGNLGTIIYSDDNGITWATASDKAHFGSDNIYGVAYSSSLTRYVAVGANSKLAWSDDGDVWEAVDDPGCGPVSLYSVAWSSSLSLFIVGGEEGCLLVSSDGKFWISTNPPDSYNIYKKSQGVYGYIGNARGEFSFIDYNYDPVITDSVPEAYNPFYSSNPGVVALFQQRLWFANTEDKSQTVFASRVGDFENMNFSPFIRPDDSIENTIFSSRPDGIQWLAPFNKVIKVGTVEKAWTLTSSSGGAITPTDIAIEPVLDWGASKVKPVLAGNSLIYVENKGSKVFDIFERQEYLGDTGNNLSIDASSLFEGYSIVSMAYQRTPDPIVWCVRSDGKALAMTYFKNEEIWGWHIHETDGLFKNVTVIPGEVYDEVYFTVYRNSKYLIEMLEDKWDGSDIEEAKFLDSMVTQENVTPFTVVTGLSHLEGKTVYALADGEVEGPFTVSSGQITLPSSVNIAHVGLLYESVLSPLSVEFATQSQGPSLGRTKGIGTITLRLKDSKGGKIGPRTDYLDDLSTFDYDAATVYNGDVKIAPPNIYDTDGSFYVVQDEPLPMTVSALFIDINMGDR